MEKVETAESIALREKISNDSATITAQIKAEIGELETEYLLARKEQKIGIVLIVLTFLSAHFLVAISNHIFFVLVWLVIFFFGLKYGFKYFFGKLQIIRQYNAKVNNIIFRRVLLLLNLNGSVVKEEELTNRNYIMSPWQNFLQSVKKSNTSEFVFALEDLDNSELINEPHNTNQVDNILEIDYKNSIIKIAELDIKHVTGSGKNRSTKNIFLGYLVGFELNKELTGKTFVSAEGDKRGFGNWSAFANNKLEQAKETILEWNEFESLLHVATTDEVEARYILTPNFMHDLYDWWQGRETNIRLSFIKNRLFILYPDKKIRLNQTVEIITEETVAEYLYTIAWPLQNITKLIDDVRL